MTIVDISSSVIFLFLSGIAHLVSSYEIDTSIKRCRKGVTDSDRYSYRHAKLELVGSFAAALLLVLSIKFLIEDQIVQAAIEAITTLIYSIIFVFQLNKVGRWRSQIQFCGEAVQKS